MGSAIMAVLTLLCQISPHLGWSNPFSDDPAVVAIGTEFLRIASWVPHGRRPDLLLLRHVPGIGRYASGPAPAPRALIT